MEIHSENIIEKAKTIKSAKRFRRGPAVVYKLILTRYIGGGLDYTFHKGLQQPMEGIIMKPARLEDTKKLSQVFQMLPKIALPERSQSYNFT